MKKLIISILVIAILLFTLAGCSSNEDAPGTAWATIEELTYEVKDNDVVVGSMVTKMERLAIGDYKLDKVSEDVYTLNNGTRQTMVVKDLEGNVIMESESYLNAFEPIVSYKKVNYDGKNYEVKARYDSKYYHYTLIENGKSSSGKIKHGASYIDNELLYTIIRCYTLEKDNYSRAMTVMSPFDGGKETINFSKTTTKEITVPMPDGEKKAKCSEFNIFKSGSPTGSPIKAWFLPKEEGFEIHGKHTFRSSYRIPVEMQEGNMKYTLTKIFVE